MQAIEQSRNRELEEAQLELTKVQQELRLEKQRATEGAHQASAAQDEIEELRKRLQDSSDRADEVNLKLRDFTEYPCTLDASKIREIKRMPNQALQAIEGLMFNE